MNINHTGNAECDSTRKRLLLLLSKKATSPEELDAALKEYVGAVKGLVYDLNGQQSKLCKSRIAIRCGMWKMVKYSVAGCESIKVTVNNAYSLFFLVQWWTRIGWRYHILRSWVLVFV